MKQFSKGKMVAYSLLMILLALGATLIASGMRDREQAWDFGAWTEEAVSDALQAYQREPDGDHLARLLKGLCWQYQVKKDESVKPSVLLYGQALLDQAKAGTVDLEQMDEDGVLSQVLRVLREAGAR